MEIEIIDKKGVVQEQKNKKEETVVYFTEHELQKLLATDNDLYRMIYRFYYETGSRCNEARMVKFKDIDLKQGKVQIELLKKRVQRFRKVIITDKLISLLLQHKIKYKLNDTDYIFAKGMGKNAVSKQAMDKMLKNDCQICGIAIDKAHLHTLRHTRAIQLLDAGMDIRMLQLYLGHESILTTVRYLQFSNKHMDKAVLEANNIIGI